MKYYRLKKQSDFQKLFTAGTRLFSPSVTMLVRPAKRTTMGISVGKKHGKALQRNRIKRLLREAFRANLGEMNGAYCIVLLPKGGEKYSFHTYKADIARMIKKGNLWWLTCGLYWEKTVGFYAKPCGNRMEKCCVCGWLYCIKKSSRNILVCFAPLVRNTL